jgi:hypothetical protein
VLQGEPGPERLTLTTYCESLTDEGIERITRWLERQDDARLVTVDVFTRASGRVNDRANRYDADDAATSDPLR